MSGIHAYDRSLAHQHQSAWLAAPVSVMLDNNSADIMVRVKYIFRSIKNGENGLDITASNAA